MKVDKQVNYRTNFENKRPTVAVLIVDIVKVLHSEE
jgi:hypothetical protein